MLPPLAPQAPLGSEVPARPHGRHPGRLSPASLLALFLLAICLRLAHVGLVGAEQEMPGLTRKVEATADHLLAGEGFWQQVGRAPVPYCDRLPGGVILFAMARLLAGHSFLGLVMVHAAIASLAAPLLGAAAARLAGSRAGLVAGFLVAAWPPSWKADVQLLETGATGAALAATLLGLIAARDERAQGGPARWPLALIAVGSLAAFALRPDAMLVPALAALLLAWPSPFRWSAIRWKGPLLVVLLPLTVALPWTVRNARVADGAFLSVGLGANLLGALGESVVATRPLLDDQGVARSEGHDSLFWPNPKQRDAERVRLALALIAEHPQGYAKGCVRRLAVSLSFYQGRLWPWGSLPEEHLARFRQENPGQARYAGLFRSTLDWARAEPIPALLTLLWGPLLVGAVAWAAWRLRRRPAELALLLALPVYGLVVHVPLHAEPRYFMPFVGILLVTATTGLWSRSYGQDRA